MTADSVLYETVNKSSHTTVNDGREESLSFFHDPKYGTKCFPYQFITSFSFQIRDEVIIHLLNAYYN